MFMRKIFSVIICLVIGATLFAVAPVVLAKEKTALYEDINVSFTYPGWPSIKETMSSTSGITTAVGNDQCSFILSAVPLDSGTFKSFVNDVIKEQSKAMAVKFNSKKIAASSFDLDSTITMENQKIHQYAYGIMTPANVIYQLTFTALEGSFKAACQPYIKTTTKSLKAAKPKLSEKVIATEFKKYFKELNIGSKPEGKDNLNKFFRANVFYSAMPLCFKGKVSKDIPAGVLKIVVYNVGNKSKAKEQLINTVIKKGEITNCEQLSLAPGRYEYKIFVNKKAGVIFPFMVQEEPVENSSQPEAAADNTLSEQPDKGKFNEYFTNINLAKLPAGAEFDPQKIVKTKIFAAVEQFCINMDMIKQIPANTLSSAVYDVNAKQDAQPRSGTFPQTLGPGPGQNMGNTVSCAPLEQAVGKYEYKIYINDSLVAVLPFEVK
jgi:hypothetical protein